MTKQELKELKAGTIIYDGYTEGVIKERAGEKVIEIWIPVSSMSNDARRPEERPERWSVIEEVEA